MSVVDVGGVAVVAALPLAQNSLKTQCDNDRLAGIVNPLAVCEL
jgi:hypothetical protein